LQSFGAKVILAARNHEKAEEAKRAILRKVPEAELELLLIDLKAWVQFAALALKSSKKIRNLIFWF